MSRTARILVLILLNYYSWAINPLAEWSKPFPKQHLVTRQSPAIDDTPERSIQPKESDNTHYEDIVVFALKAAIAAFHVDPATFIDDRNHLKVYFEAHALTQVSHLLLPGSGSGLLDHCILKQSKCDAICRLPVVIEKETPHYLQVRLPLILDNEQKVDVTLSIDRAYQSPLRISNFSLEIPS
jgi:hypothetical protein